ncbi:sugar ABC transporter substrate-binding protein [Mycobacterium heidelbergense]|uniref:Sugar ABC transporter substrate-binding protein n=1 Tax=Mycobacterium heidelbergense TaxID=53376 RepID=A0A1X0DB10_MYCHE|nr:sugar ABC transporter substrate-binding protein [Mycobacterium heidelbergense]MCV7051284.1 sugar ABC transporter substrate-binding protein [Mycobacterium heidelbergense]ORA69595.1 sugar ABC transporter substrate-binding protein [Mycobacterium heidelbergense]BBZ51982.1 sugar ABC transporter substrate-binding lipoprotein UspC [Mycobacterium heidelbergense]
MRPRRSSLIAASLVLVAALLAAMAALLNYSGEPHGGKIVVRVRLWADQIAEAYRQSFEAFGRTHPNIEVRLDMVAYSTYFDTLRTDVAGGSADDIFWLSNAYFAAYADNGRLLDIGKTLGPAAAADWEPAVVDQFTRGGVLWGVPQLTDAGIALYYNADLLAAAGVQPAQLNGLRWSPDGDDTLRPLLARLTVDADGNAASAPGFDAGRVRQWGYNAANDPQGIYLNYIGSAGGVFQRGDEFAFDNAEAVEAFRYLVGLINHDHVAPPAADTNDNGDFSRNQFLAGRMALFQSGTYNLAPVARDARFHWGVAMLPAGPAGRVSVTNGIAAAGNSATKHPDAVRQVLTWMGSREGNAYLGRRGAAIPAVLSAQRGYFDYWAAEGVDVTPFFSVLNGPRIPAPGGAGFAAGSTALQSYFDEMFLGRGDVAVILKRAQAAANAAARR